MHVAGAPEEDTGLKRLSFVLAAFVAGLLLASLGLPAFAAPGYSQSAHASACDRAGKVEPRAGRWQTWVLTSGSQLRLARPPGRDVAKAELRELKALARQRDAAALDQIAYCNTGGLAYRWNEIAV